MRALVIALLLLGTCLSRADADPTDIDPGLQQAMDRLSASTRVGGEGWEVYDRLLHPQYSRWAMGQVFERREKFIRSLEAWWDHGMRVADRDIERIAVDTVGDLAIVRYKTTETFVGPDGPAPGFSGYVSNTWIRQDDRWLLLSAEISSIDRDH